MADDRKLLIAVLMIISVLGAVTYYDEQGNILKSNETHNVTWDKTTKVVNYTKGGNVASVVYSFEGSLPIKTAVEGKTAEKSVRSVLIEETDKVMDTVRFPYTIEVGDPEKTVITVSKYRCDQELSCGYWISATRDGKEVQVNAPIWIDTPPYLVESSRTVTTKADSSLDVAIVLKEDTKKAVENQLITYVARQPLGEATLGTKS